MIRGVWLKFGSQVGLRVFLGALLLGLAMLGAACSAENPGATANPPPSPTVPLSTATDLPQASPTSEPPATETPTAAPEQEPEASPTAESAEPEPVRTAEIDGMTQILIPAGEFTMGTNDPLAQHAYKGNGVAYPEVPAHLVSLDAYWIDKFEVNNSQYKKCVDAGACEPPFVDYTLTYNHYYGNPEFDNYPVVFVSWFNARDYCSWAGRRLPSEAEWEKAARGTDERKYPWGNEEADGSQANFCDYGCPRTHANPTYDDGWDGLSPGGAYADYASPYGVMDMAGNAWEWTSTIPQPYPYDAQDGREDQSAIDQQRIWRGGSWVNGYWYMRTTARYRSVPIYRIYSLGFRCAETADPQ